MCWECGSDSEPRPIYGEHKGVELYGTFGRMYQELADGKPAILPRGVEFRFCGIPPEINERQRRGDEAQLERQRRATLPKYPSKAPLPTLWAAEWCAAFRELAYHQQEVEISRLEANYTPTPRSFHEIVSEPCHATAHIIRQVLNSMRRAISAHLPAIITAIIIFEALVCFALWLLVAATAS